METIYQRGEEPIQGGGADFHKANPNLTPEWIIKYTRQSKDVAVPIVETRELTKMADEKIVPFPTKMSKSPEKIRRIDSYGNLTVSNRVAEVELRNAAVLQNAA